MEPVRPETSLTRVLEPGSARRLEQGLGFTTVQQLLDHFPRTYSPHNALTGFSGLREGEYATFIARVDSTSLRRLHNRRTEVLDVTVRDISGEELNLGFFGGRQFQRQLREGAVAVFQGKVRIFRGEPTLTNPSFDVLTGPHGQDEPASTDPEVGEVLPLYPATAKTTSMFIHRCVRLVLDQVDFSTWLDPVPEAVAEQESLPSLGEAYEMVHRPATMEQPELGLRRFRFSEALLLQGLMERRRRLAGELQGVPAPARTGGLLEAFDAQLPFELTEGQRSCGELIAADLAGQHPMNRLLQGEVGSGKTLVALRAMLQVVDAGAQAVLVAPTEVLAAQHLRSLRKALGPLADQTRTGLLAESGSPGPVKLTLLTGSLSAAERRQALLDIASCEAGIVIGTHAVLGEKVQFAQLGLVVIDEQHRFGVSQRNALRERYTPTPHMLVMSATPIPRSVAMTAFGDLELTVLHGLPAGRSRIETHVVPTVLGPRWSERVWERVAEEASAGRQVFVVCPRISSQDRSQEQIQRQLRDRFGFTDDAAAVSFTTARPEGKVVWVDFRREQAVEHLTNDASVEALARHFAEHPALSKLRTGTLHGQMPAAEAAEVMGAFESGDLQVLIATTVIEVGVDVPAASLMVILDADAFGVSTLHQLRGRIGRGRTESNQCLLVTRLPTEHPSAQRLTEVAEHTDGMQLALLDLQRRREGDVLGAAQSGTASTLRLLRIVDDAEIIEAAAAHIRRLTDSDPQWQSAPALWRAVEAWRLEHTGAEDYVHQS